MLPAGGPDRLGGADDRRRPDVRAEDDRPRVPGEQSSNVLFRALAERDQDLGEHLEEVAELAVAVGVKLGLRQEQVHQLRWAARLHDVGKMAVPESILRKPGPLDDHEWEFVRSHTIVGERILEAAPSLGNAGAARAQHPRALRRNRLSRSARRRGDPLGARMISVATRSTRWSPTGPTARRSPSARSPSGAAQGSGTQFDPHVVSAFLERVRGAEPDAPASPRATGDAVAGRRSRPGARRERLETLEPGFDVGLRP